MPFDFSGKRFLVTGAGRDLGRAIAKAIAAAGGEVYVLGRNKENIESLMQECDNIHPVIADLSDWEATKHELNQLPALHCVVNNAGHTNFSLVSALDVEKKQPYRSIKCRNSSANQCHPRHGKENDRSWSTWVHCKCLKV